MFLWGEEDAKVWHFVYIANTVGVNMPVITLGC